MRVGKVRRILENAAACALELGVQLEVAVRWRAVDLARDVNNCSQRLCYPRHWMQDMMDARNETAAEVGAIESCGIGM